MRNVNFDFLCSAGSQWNILEKQQLARLAKLKTPEWLELNDPRKKNRENPDFVPRKPSFAKFESLGSFLTKLAYDSQHFGRGTTRAEDAQGTPTQSHVSASILAYEEDLVKTSVDNMAWARAILEKSTTTVNGAVYEAQRVCEYLGAQST